MTKFVITETLLSSVSFKTIMVPLHRGSFVFVHLYSAFSIDPLRGKFIPKITIFTILGAVSPHFSSHKGEIWHEGADLELPPTSQIF